MHLTVSNIAGWKFFGSVASNGGSGFCSRNNRYTAPATSLRKSLLTKLDRGREGGKWREKSEALGFLGFHGQGQGQNSGIDHSKGQEVLLVDIIASEFLRGLENGVGLTKDGETGPQVGSKVRLRRLFLRIASSEVWKVLRFLDRGVIENDRVAENIELRPHKESRRTKTWQGVVIHSWPTLVPGWLGRSFGPDWPLKLVGTLVAL